MTSFKQIDGSYLEGGGQILRIATTLSSLLNIPVQINNIRANRPRPGLASQHLQGLLLARDITQGVLIGAKIGSKSVQFIPRKITSGTYNIDTKTAGSITLILQIGIPILLYAGSSSFLKLRGGTHVPFAPFLEFFTKVLPVYLPFLENAKIKCKQFGFYPKGDGLVTCHLEPLSSQPLPPIEHLQFGELMDVNGFVLTSGELPINLAQKNAQTIFQYFKHEKLFFRDNEQSYQNVRIDFHRENHSSDGIAIMLMANTTSRCCLSSSVLVSRNDLQSDSYGKQASEELMKELRNGPAVDQYTQDQLIIYMALAYGRSKILTGDITLHTKTAIWITELLTGVKFEIYPSKDKEGLNLIECEGIGYETKRYY